MGKLNVFEKGNYRGLKLTDYILKIVEKTIKNLIRSSHWWNSVWFHTKMSKCKHNFYFGWVTGETFNNKKIICTLHLLIWRKLLIGYLRILHALRKLGLEIILAKIVESMYENSRSWFRVSFNYNFLVHVELHQVSVLRPLLFTMVLEIKC